MNSSLEGKALHQRVSADLNSRELMHAAMDGLDVHRAAVAPFFWGWHYIRKLVDRPVWEMVHGPAGVILERLTALDSRHGCDWVLAAFPGTGLLEGKRLLREEKDRVVFIDDSSGDKWYLDRRTCRLTPAQEPRVRHVRDLPRNSAEARTLLECQGSSGFPVVIPSMDIRSRFPDRFICCAVDPPFSVLANYLGFAGRARLAEDNPSLLAWMAEQILGDVEALAARYAADDVDGVVLVDWWEPVGLEFYREWVVPIHRRISDALRSAGLRSIFYLHRGDTAGGFQETLETIAGLGFDAIAMEEGGGGIDMDIVEARAVVGPDVCLFGNFDPQLFLTGDREVIRQETLRQLQAGPTSFILGTGSSIPDSADPRAVDCWVQRTTDFTDFHRGQG